MEFIANSMVFKAYNAKFSGRWWQIFDELGKHTEL